MGNTSLVEARHVVEQDQIAFEAQELRKHLAAAPTAAVVKEAEVPAEEGQELAALLTARSQKLRLRGKAAASKAAAQSAVGAEAAEKEAPLTAVAAVVAAKRQAMESDTGSESATSSSSPSGPQSPRAKLLARRKTARGAHMEKVRGEAATEQAAAATGEEGQAVET